MPVTNAMDEADVIILASPVYVYHATGAMKAFLDHYGYRWMVHRPEESMFKKQGVCIHGGQSVFLGCWQDLQIRQRGRGDCVGRC